jgi:enoyl-CoA hydratase/carnithine racemase
MLEDLIVRKQEAGWLEVGIARPEKRNALREQTAEELLATLESAETDPEVRVVLIHGAPPVFCAGVDTGSFAPPAGGPFEQWRQRRSTRKISRLYRSLPEFTKPCIAVVDGYALGGGFELALMCDLIVASSAAEFGLTEVRLGMLPGGGGTQTLARIVGRAAAKKMIWTGERISGERAAELGIVTVLSEPGAALDDARKLAAQIAANAPLPIMFAKTLIDQGVDMTARQGLMQEGDLSFALSFSQDRQEGLAAFKEKRKAVFSGK